MKNKVCVTADELPNLISGVPVVVKVLENLCQEEVAMNDPSPDPNSPRLKLAGPDPPYLTHIPTVYVPAGILDSPYGVIAQNEADDVAVDASFDPSFAA
jgi:hypothetical protein